MLGRPAGTTSPSSGTEPGRCRPSRSSSTAWRTRAPAECLHRGMDAVRDRARPVPGRPSGGVRSGVDVSGDLGRDHPAVVRLVAASCVAVGIARPGCRLRRAGGDARRTGSWGTGVARSGHARRPPSDACGHGRRGRAHRRACNSSVTDAPRSGSASAPAARRGGWRSMVVSSPRRQILPQRSRSGCEQW